MPNGPLWKANVNNPAHEIYMYTHSNISMPNLKNNLS